MVSVDQRWVDRIGPEAAEQVARAWVVRRAGGFLTFLFVGLEIAFQLANYYRPGILASVPLLFVGTFCLFYSQRYFVAARRLIAEQVGLPRNRAKFVPISRGMDDIDRWLAARGKPGWPVKGWR